MALRQVERARADFAADRDVVKLATRLSELLRRTMLAYAPRRDVAGLTGAALALSLPLIVATALLAALPAMRLAVKTSPAALLREFVN